MSISHLLVVLLIVFVVFGLGKLPSVMADLAKGIKAFRDNLNKDETSSNTSNNNCNCITKKPDA